jgi:hypothetical protein
VVKPGSSVRSLRLRAVLPDCNGGLYEGYMRDFKGAKLCGRTQVYKALVQRQLQQASTFVESNIALR